MRTIAGLVASSAALYLGFSPTTTAAPYPSSPYAVPGSFEAEHFDRGGQGVGYQDQTTGNQGDANFRTNDSVDIFQSHDTGGNSRAVKNFASGERLIFTVNVARTATYSSEVRAATHASVPDASFRVLVDGVDATGAVVLPNTGGWNNYQWVGKRSLQLTAGQRRIEIVSERPWFNLNTIRFAEQPATPYSGAPIPVPGTFEAEHFDLGGSGLGYQDASPGNQGDAGFRATEDVDVFTSGDAGGNSFAVKNFEGGERLFFTVSVATAGTYAVELRAATHASYPNTSYRIEVDGVSAGSAVTLPDTGGWTNYQWVGLREIPLAAGTHRLAIVSDRAYFNLNSVRLSQPAPSAPPPPPAPQAGLLFKSGFEGLVVLGQPLLFGNGAWQDITGLDTETGQAWPPLLWGGASSRLQLVAGDGVAVNALTLGNYMHNALETVSGRKGSTTRALYSHIQQSVGGATENWNSTQDSFQIHPGSSGQGDLYLSYWLKFQPDLVSRMTQNGWAGRVVSDWKTGTGSGGGGDYRVVFSVFGDGANDRLYWHVKGDNVANGGLPEQIFWEQTNMNVPVPVGRWFRVEVFVHRSTGSDGRVWVAVDGQQIFNRTGSNIGVNGLPWNRIMPFLNYSTGQILPAYQWVDDIELWDRFPAHASQH